MIEELRILSYVLAFIGGGLVALVILALCKACSHNSELDWQDENVTPAWKSRTTTTTHYQSAEMPPLRNGGKP